MNSFLFVIDSLHCGGAEKSLVSLLNSIDYIKCKVDLLLFKRGGEFESSLPVEVNILDVPEYYGVVSKCKKVNLLKKIKYYYFRVKTSILLRIKNSRHSEQIVYGSIKNILKKLDKVYDVAVAYSQGMPTYFVGEKVEAKSKFAWINCDYARTKYDKNIDKKFYDKYTNIVAVSNYVYESIYKLNYDYKNKLVVLRDIVNPVVIRKLSEEFYPEEYTTKDYIITTVGRIAEVKGYDLLVKSAKLLKEYNFKFKWYIVGDGPERLVIEEMIKKYNLDNDVILLGNKSNPYPYIKNCNLYVQTSRKEGFGLSVIEAKILKKPIICTSFETAYEIINDKINGIIVNKNEYDISKAIININNDTNLMDKIINNLERDVPYSTVDEVNKLYELSGINV